MNSKFLDDVTHVKSSSKTLPERVADQIRQLIIDRHMENGDQLPNEFELAQQLLYFLTCHENTPGLSFFANCVTNFFTIIITIRIY